MWTFIAGTAEEHEYSQSGDYTFDPKFFRVLVRAQFEPGARRSLKHAGKHNVLRVPEGINGVRGIKESE